MLFSQLSGNVNDALLSQDGVDISLYYILFFGFGFASVSIFMILFMVWRRRKCIVDKVIEAELIEKYQDFLTSFLLLPLDESFLGIQKSDRQSSRLDSKDIQDPYRRRILADQIYLLHSQLSGQQAVQLVNYFFGLGLQEEILNMINSSNWTNKVKGMQMIQAFELVEYVDKIDEYVNHSNRDLSIHAIVVRLSLDRSLAVLSEINYNLNTWECHKVYDAIKRFRIDSTDLLDIQSSANTGFDFLNRLTDAFNMPSKSKVDKKLQYV